MAKTRKVAKKGAEDTKVTNVTKDPSELLEYLQVPRQSPQQIKTRGVKTLVLNAVKTNDEMKAREGTYWDEKEVKEIIDEDVDVYVIPDKEKPNEKKLLARFRKNVIDHDLLKEAWLALYKTAAPSRNRGAAAGPIQLTSN